MNDNYSKKDVVALLYDEWKYRTTNFWRLSFKFNLLSLTVILLPILQEAIVNLEALNIIVYILPFVGIVASIIICWYTTWEKRVLVKIRNAILMRIGADEDLSGIFDSDKKYDRLPLVLCGAQCFLAITIFVSLIM